ncbi:hypothetical protein [Microcoleus vaginatus]|uniref:hypothetical protein n=1 Tax=Microcoleus vaginatus TaxID=119532 RepID=UPI00403F2FD9
MPKLCTIELQPLFEDFLTLWVVSEFWEGAIEPLQTVSIGNRTPKRRFIFFWRRGMMGIVGALIRMPI